MLSSLIATTSWVSLCYKQKIYIGSSCNTDTVLLDKRMHTAYLFAMLFSLYALLLQYILGFYASDEFI